MSFDFPDCRQQYIITGIAHVYIWLCNLKFVTLDCVLPENKLTKTTFYIIGPLWSMCAFGSIRFINTYLKHSTIYTYNYGHGITFWHCQKTQNQFHEEKDV